LRPARRRGLIAQRLAQEANKANGWNAVVNILANIFGAAGAIVFIGYFAYKVDEPPLIIIVVLCLALMVYSFYDDMRNDRTIARFHMENENKI
jgi:Flp pilus assembly protein TadB